MAHCVARSIAVTSEVRVQPSTATTPSRTSIATTRAAPKRATADVEELGLERGRADHDAIRTRFESGPDRLDRPVSATDLHGDAGRGDRPDELERRITGEGAVEIDQVEATGSLGRIATSESERVASFERDGLAATLREPYDPALEHVDSRNDLEGSC